MATPYARSLTLLREAGDDRAIEGALALFLTSPANKLLTKHFTYLRHFVTCRGYGATIAKRLVTDKFTFFLPSSLYVSASCVFS